MMHSLKTIVVTVILTLMAPIYVISQIQIEQLYCENRIAPLGIDNPNPKLTWVLSSDKKNKSQSAYQVQVSEDPDGFPSGIIWDSQKTNSDQSVRVMYEGPELLSLKKYFWRVKIWDEKGKASQWSNITVWQMGMMDLASWKAQWITMGYDESPKRESPILRNEFSITKEIAQATAVITSHGIYQSYLNGEKIGDAYLTPGWTSYNKRLQYQLYDVTSQLKQGKNAISAHLGSGWYRSPLAWGDNKDIYGDELALLAQLNITYVDGSSEVIGTDTHWKSHKSSIVSSEIYNGEEIDGRLRIDGWKNAGFDDSQWSATKAKSYGFENLVATYNEPVKKHDGFAPLEMITTPEGDRVIDFGQNLVGWVEVNIQGNLGDSLILEHAEVLDKNGNFYTENLRLADQRNSYVLAGKGTEKFEPHFTWQGFRYVRVRGTVKNISEANFRAVALYSDMRKTGNFITSNPLLNQLQHNIQWGQYGNFVDVPTDCPQRDERLGWTGDAQVFSPTAAYNMHVNNFFNKWMKDVAADQREDGSVPFVVPNVLNPTDFGSAGWSDVATIIPWNMYLIYGDTDILKNQYQSMKSWVDFISAQSNNNLWNTGFHFGDWLFYRPDDDNDGRSAITDKYLIAQCFYAHSTQLLINAANVLGKQEDVAAYTRQLAKIKNAFVGEYVTPNGRLVSSSQTAYVLALNFDMLPENLRQQAADRLVENIKSYDFHLTTGFLGTPYLGHVLSRFGYHDVAYTLLMQKTYPSWLYPVTVGATTIWERWDGRKPDGSFQTPSMNSFNHYAYGAIGDWMYRELGGINNSEVFGETGYKKIILTPHFKNAYKTDKVKEQNKGELLTETNASLDTYYGKIGSHWKIIGDQITYVVTIPVNTTADIYFPDQNPTSIKESGRFLEKSKEVKSLQQENGNIVITLGSGTYRFTLDK